MAPENHTFLIEQESLGEAIVAGIGAARRSSTPSPPERSPKRHISAAGMRRGAGPNAICAFLDYFHSVSIQVRDRAHHVVIICTIPPTNDVECYHSVLIRPLLPSLIRGDWRLLAPEAASSGGCPPIPPLVIGLERLVACSLGTSIALVAARDAPGFVAPQCCGGTKRLMTWDPHVANW